MEHRYRLLNSSGHDVRIVELVNRQPCCGELVVGKTILRPGDETEVVVTLSVRQEFGDVVHDTVVLTEPPQPEQLVLRTMARAVPSIRIEEVTPIRGLILLSSERPRPAEFRVFASGSSTEPPIDLDRVELRATIKVAWTGPKEESPSDDGLMVQSRRFTVWLDPTGSPGERRAEIVLRDGEQPRFRHVVSWEAISPITASPKMIVMQPGKRDYRITLTSRDRKSFRITRIECQVSGIRGRAASADAALVQPVEIVREGAPRPEGGRGIVTVYTDHPAQGRVDLPFVVLD